MHCHAAAAALRAAQTRTQWPERTTSTNMAARHFQSTTRPGQAVVTLDIVGGAAPDGPTAQSSLCFCCDPFAENVEYSRAAPAAASETSRMHRILSHVEPSSKVPRNLLVDGIPTAEIPWCRDVTAEAVAAAPRRQLATGFRSPPSAVLAPAAAESALGAAKQSAVDIIEAEAAELDALCLHIWNNPGLGYTEEEHLASEAICNFFESRGVEVERNYCGIKTAFRATLTTEGAAAEAGPTVAICCEFDALPGIGHACGHNLIAEATSAGFLGVKAALAEVTEAEAAVTAGTVVLIGTPAEEGGAGKVELIKRGGFADVDVAMMVHPGPGYTLYSGGNAMESVVLTYKGVNSHAAGAPWDGVNALNAVIQAFNNVDAMRQQMKPSWRVHGVIHEGGLKPNIIPDKCVAEWYIRALSVEDVAELRRKVEGCFKGAAISTGCELEMEWKADTAKTDFEAGCHMYANMVSNGPMCESFRENWRALGQPEWPTFDEDQVKVMAGGGSTDMGNVSHIIPSIHPSFKIDTKFGNHHPGFTEFTGKAHNMETARVAGKTVAMTTLDLLGSPELVSAAKEAFEAEERRMWTVDIASA